MSKSACTLFCSVKLNQPFTGIKIKVFLTGGGEAIRGFLGLYSSYPSVKQLLYVNCSKMQSESLVDALWDQVDWKSGGFGDRLGSCLWAAANNSIFRLRDGTSQKVTDLFSEISILKKKKQQHVLHMVSPHLQCQFPHVFQVITVQIYNTLWLMKGY